LSLQLAPSLYHVKNIIFEYKPESLHSEEEKGRSRAGLPRSSLRAPPMTQEVSQTETGEVLLAAFDLIADTSESTRAKTAETFLELLGARVRNPNTRSAYRVAWRSFLAFCSARQLELENVKAYHVAARAGYGSKKNEGKNTVYRCTRRLEKLSIFGLNALTWQQIQVLHFFLPSAKIVKRSNRDAWIVGVS
jgi:hypothetical protein